MDKQYEGEGADIVRLETQMGNMIRLVEGQGRELREVAQCTIENTALIKQTCALLQELRSVKDAQQLQALEQVAQRKDIETNKKHTYWLLTIITGLLSTGIAMDNTTISDTITAATKGIIK